MKERELISILSEYDLFLLPESDTKFAIKKSGIANPILLFRTDEEYRGSVTVKSINASLYSNTQIKVALLSTHYYLREQEV